MSEPRPGLARAQAHAGVFAAFAVVALVVTALSGAVLGALGPSGAAAVRESFANAAPADRAARWQIRAAEDAAGQAEAAAAILDERLGAVGVPWRREVTTSAVRVDDANEAVFLADAAFADRARLESGSWPAPGGGSGEIEAAVHAGALEALGVTVGEVLHPAEGPAIRIVGAWMPLDAADPVWFGDPLAATGASGTLAGPFLVAEDALAAVPAGAYARWTALPETERLAPADLAGIREAVDSVEALFRADPAVGTDGVTATGGLSAELAALGRATAAVGALAPVPVLLLAVAGALAVQRLTALLLESRERETLLLRARGASAGWFTAHALAEALLVAVPAAAAGGGLAAAFLALAGGDAAVLPSVAAATVAGCAAIVAAATWIDARRPAVRDGGAASGRVRRGLAAGIAVVLAVLTGLAFLRFARTGSPVGPGGTIDPLAVAAPVLGLLTASVAAVLLLPPAAAALAGRASRRDGLLPVLPLRQLSRRASLHRAAVLLTVLATGGTVLAASVAGTWAGLDRADTLLQTGGEVRVDLLGDPGYAGEDEPADPLAGREDADRVARALVAPARAGSLPLVFVAADGIDVAGSGGETGGRLPVIVTDALAEAVDAEPGDPVDIRLAAGGGVVAAVVAERRATLPRVDGAGAAVAYDDFATHQTAAGERVPLPGERWVDAEDPAALAAELNREQPVPLVARDRQEASSAPFTGPVLAALFAGAAGTAALALLGLIALGAALARERHAETLVLRAVGLPARAQGRSRAIELGVAFAGAAILGVVAGLVVSAATAGGLARAAVATAPADLAAAPGFAWWPWLAITVVFAAAAILVIRTASARLSREAARPGIRPEEP
ncbi:hypothetical protein [Agromyces archimandritae]|uniref:FtsX-like permease family protein n=1 Tax=Agromyces archimandritae TaxID=2781962 RepID=A0A975FJY6_9MICO|nr:hypothetical protein [Agromyces archimandritae]QTX03918.1 hypothetical protein G127AT_11455 [Agromyces archimandritae]